MLIALLALAASAADLTLEARVPTEIYVDGNVVAKLYQPGALRVRVSEAPHELRVFINGESTQQVVDMTHTESSVVIIGRTGISWPENVLAVPVEADIEIEGRVSFRSVADEDVVVTIGRDRRTISPGEETEWVVGPGTHSMSLRNSGGTVIWVRGQLHIDGDDAIVQLADGRMPEVLGQGGQFVANGG
ncbi:MAG: hypothetical protein ACJATT_002356 [Myxococcota bacterium]|jgi:hypothetical protein